jgi:hypothetical protein
VGDDRGLELDELGLRKFCGAEYGDAGEGAADHGDFVAGVEAGAGLAVFVDLVGEGSAVGDPEAEVEEEIWDAGEEADGLDTLVFGFFEKRAEEFAAGTLAFGFGLDDDGADFGEMGSVEVEGSAAEEDTGFRLGDLEVADILADFCVVAAEQSAVSGEGVHELEDIHGVLELGSTDGGSAYAGARGEGGGGIAEWRDRSGERGQFGGSFRLWGYLPHLPKIGKIFKALDLGSD